MEAEEIQTSVPQCLSLASGISVCTSIAEREEVDRAAAACFPSFTSFRSSILYEQTSGDNNICDRCHLLLDQTLWHCVLVVVGHAETRNTGRRSLSCGLFLLMTGERSSRRSDLCVCQDNEAKKLIHHYVFVQDMELPSQEPMQTFFFCTGDKLFLLSSRSGDVRSGWPSAECKSQGVERHQ